MMRSMTNTTHTAEDTECIHRIDTSWCSLCKPVAPKRTLGEQYDAGTEGIHELHSGNGTGAFIVRWTIGNRILWVGHRVDGTRSIRKTMRAARQWVEAA